MGRYSYSSRLTTNDCHAISTKFLNKHHYFDGGGRYGGMNWSSGGEVTGSINFDISTRLGEEYIRFIYTKTDRQTDQKTDINYKARLECTYCQFGGRRWWFICPLVVNGHSCNRRVGVLYLGGKYFGCRHCYNLTYQSCKEHDKRMDHLNKNPELLMSYLNSKNLSKSLLAIKAGFKYL